MLNFCIGFVVGALCAILILSICIASKQREEIYTQEDFYKENKYK